jgi:hypothetical protein
VSQIREGLDDTRRLDWLEKQECQVTLDTVDAIIEMPREFGLTVVRRETLRAAIDEAMKAEEEGK